MKKSILLIIIGLFILIGTSSCLTAVSIKSIHKNRLLVSQAWGNIFGTIDYQNGSIVKTANVVASHHIIDILFHNESWYPYYDQTDENGQYSIDLPPGDYFIVAFKIIGQRGWAAQSSIAIADGEQKEVSMTIRTFFDNTKIENHQVLSKICFS